MSEVDPHSATSPRPYHHGDLRQALIEAALAFIAREGVEALSIRAIAKQAGVSPGAPFRHFADRTALLTAVAEEATRRFLAEIAAATAREADPSPRARLLAIGRAYLSWARANPTYFEIVSTRRLIDYRGSTMLVAANAAVQEDMARLILALRPEYGQAELRAMKLMLRAFVYGLARMATDDHLADWGVPDAEAAAVSDAALVRLLDAVLPERVGD